MKALFEGEPWYQAFTLRTGTAEADAGETVTGVVIEGDALLVHAVNVDVLKPVYVGLKRAVRSGQGTHSCSGEANRSPELLRHDHKHHP